LRGEKRWLMNVQGSIPGSPRKYILVVDDDEGMRAALDIVLSPNYRVMVAVDGLDGCAKANEMPPPDLIITDVSMPNLDGIAMIRRIRENDALQHVPVIFLTGLIWAASLLADMPVGTFAYLPKPTSPGMLETKVKRALWH
jgi:CheY-like chemotaxis protein